VNRPSLTRPTRHLTEEFLRGIGWYGGATFLPTGGVPVLTDPYYVRGVSTANSTQLHDLLARSR
jgi:hypothetical protein